MIVLSLLRPIGKIMIHFGFMLRNVFTHNRYWFMFWFNDPKKATKKTPGYFYRGVFLGPFGVFYKREIKK